jgi:hypothetical protein
VAKSSKCRGSWPQLSLSIDGNKVMDLTVSSTSWSVYSLTKNLTVGTHNITINYFAISKNNNCQPSLYLDVINFYGPQSVTPAPAVTLSATPLSITTGGNSTLTWSSTNADSCL